MSVHLSLRICVRVWVGEGGDRGRVKTVRVWVGEGGDRGVVKTSLTKIVIDSLSQRDTL